MCLTYVCPLKKQFPSLPGADLFLSISVVGISRVDIKGMSFEECDYIPVVMVKFMGSLDFGPPTWWCCCTGDESVFSIFISECCDNAARRWVPGAVISHLYSTVQTTSSPSSQL